jgi:anti-sigma-K factor RskA
MTGQHLTDEQFTDLLSGDYTAEASRHMLACAQCQEEFERVQASIEDFVTLSLEWAKRRASTSISAPWAFIRGWHSASSWAAAAAILAAAILFGLHQGRLLSPDVISVSGSQPAESASEVADDNRLLMAIDKEIRWQPESPISIDDLTPSADRPHARLSPGLRN